MAETTLPPVRGARRFGVCATLAVAAAGTGATAGAAAGTLGRALAGPLPAAAVVGVTAAAVVADSVHRSTGRWRPWAVGRQVPVAWSRLFGPATAAALYGARLGVGPLTILSSWLWWAAALVGASAGPAAGALTGVAFALGRVGATVAAGWGAAGTSGAAMAGRAVRLQRLDRATGRGAGAAALVALVVLAGCGGDDASAPDPLEAVGAAPPGGSGSPPTSPAPAGVDSAGVDSADAGGAGVDSADAGGAGVDSAGVDSADAGGAGASDGAPMVASGPAGPATTTAPPPTPDDVVPDLAAVLALEVPVDDLAALVVVEGPPGFTLLPDGELGSGPLDLDAASAAEADAAAERALLSTRGFEAGHARAWSGPDGATAVVVAYRFATPGGAGAYLVDGAETALARLAVPFPVPGLDGAFGFTQVDDAGPEPFVAHAVAMVRGRAFLLVLAGGPDPAADPARTVELAIAQDRRIRDLAGGA